MLATVASTIDPAVRELSREMLPRADELAARLAHRIREQEAIYTEGYLVTAEDLQQSCRDNLSYVLRRLGGEVQVPTDAPRATGVRRAEAAVPLSAVLQAFRIGGRLIWEMLVEEAPDHTAEEILLRSAADVWAVSDELADAAAEGYRSASAELARHDTQLRSALLNSLLDGKLGDGSRLWESAALLKLPQHGEYLIVSAEGGAPGEEAIPKVEDHLRHSGVTSVWRLDADFQDGLVILRPRFGIEKVCAALAGLAHGRIGVSEVFGGLEHSPAALRQARLACATGTPGSTTLVRFDHEPVAVLLVSAPDAAHGVVRRVLGPVLTLPEADRAVVVDTARVWLAHAGSSPAAATQLHVHRNTVRYRLRRLEELTGRNLANPLEVAEIHIALECARMLGLT